MLKAKLISPAKLEIMFSTILLETSSEAKSPQSHLEKRGKEGSGFLKRGENRGDLPHCGGCEM